jgi:YD repeat-containing protein
VYGSPHPHRLTSYAGTTLTYDNDGNRKTKGAATTYDYDPLGRMTYAEGPDGSETNAYDESTSRVVRYSPEEMSVRHYLAGGMVEVDQSELRRYFFLGSRRVAMDTVTLPSSPPNPIWTDAPSILATAFAGRGKGGGSVATADAINVGFFRVEARREWRRSVTRFRRRDPHLERRGRVASGGASTIARGVDHTLGAVLPQPVAQPVADDELEFSRLLRAYPPGFADHVPGTRAEVQVLVGKEDRRAADRKGGSDPQRDAAGVRPHRERNVAAEVEISSVDQHLLGKKRGPRRIVGRPGVVVRQAAPHAPVGVEREAEQEDEDHQPEQIREHVEEPTCPLFPRHDANRQGEQPDPEAHREAEEHERGHAGHHGGEEAAQ